MPITVFSGRPGSGKTTKLAETVMRLLERNQRFFERTGIVRHIYLNFHLHPALEEAYSECIRHWENLEELEVLKDVDVVIDEIGNYFDAKRWADLSFSIRRWLMQHRKFGIEIYGNAQDFAQVDISFRRMTSDLFYLVKLMSSRDPSPTRPPVKYIWGISIIYRMQPTDYKENQKENKTDFSGLLWINKAKCEIFNTREEIKPGIFPPLKHTERFCAAVGCEFKKVIHQ